MDKKDYEDVVGHAEEWDEALLSYIKEDEKWHVRLTDYDGLQAIGRGNSLFGAYLDALDAVIF